ncbi:MAG: SPOR domain-containing protein [Gammaproteobacteria bacterium]
MKPDLKNPQESEPRRGRGVLWFIAGIVVAVILIVAFPGIKQMLHHAEKSTLEHASALKNKLGKARPGKSATSSGPHFDFYQLLKHPTQILTSGESSEVATPPANQPVAQAGNYILQVASFRDAKAASALKAQLALWGIHASVQAVNVQDETWHRVNIGPLSDLNKLNAVRSQLAKHQLHALVIHANK